MFCCQTRFFNLNFLKFENENIQPLVFKTIPSSHRAGCSGMRRTERPLRSAESKMKLNNLMSYMLCHTESSGESSLETVWKRAGTSKNYSADYQISHLSVPFSHLRHLTLKRYFTFYDVRLCGVLMSSWCLTCSRKTVRALSVWRNQREILMKC